MPVINAYIAIVSVSTILIIAAKTNVLKEKQGISKELLVKGETQDKRKDDQLLLLTHQVANIDIHNA